MKWKTLESVEQLDEIKNESKEAPVALFKHSTRCNVSRTALDRLERRWLENENPGVKLYFLDLLQHRNVSNQIELQFGVEHESPQILVIRNGQSVYDSSHFEIDYDRLTEQLRKVRN